MTLWPWIMLLCAMGPMTYFMKSPKRMNMFGVAACLAMAALWSPMTAFAQGTMLVGGKTLNYIDRFGIRWTFDKPLSLEPQPDAYHYGRFANGDYWVVGPVTIVAIDPASVEMGGRIVHGSEINPAPEPATTQGFDSAVQNDPYNIYVPALNVARPNGLPISEANPLHIDSEASLVSTISDLDLNSSLDTNALWGYSASHNNPSRILSASILTVLAQPPEAGSFRPGYCGSDKTIRHNVADLRWDRLETLTAVPDTPPIAVAERWFERPWLDLRKDWMGERFYPQYNMPDNGLEIQQFVGRGALMLHLDYTQDDKEVLLVRYVQLGIDLFSVVEAGGRTNWVNRYAYGVGRKWPILFAGLLLDDAGMMAIGDKSGDYLWSGNYGPGSPPPDYIHFSEDDQTFYVAQADVDWTHSPQWEPDSRDAEQIPYETSDIGLPEWGIRHATDPWESNKYWGTRYRNIVGSTLEGFVLAVHIMDAKTLWNHDALFDYMDRYVELDGYRKDSFLKNMWNTYRADYPPVWSGQ